MEKLLVIPLAVFWGAAASDAAAVTELCIAGFVADKTVQAVGRGSFGKIIGKMKFQSSERSDKNRGRSWAGR